MQSHFKITFPLILTFGDSSAINFTFKRSDTLEFKTGIYYLCGHNGSGKTTFVNMLSLISGYIGEKVNDMGVIRFNGEPYNGGDFNYIRAAEIREKYFCIFPQKTFFLPISTRDNYVVLNGTEKEKEESFSSLESPDFLSGGQQQKILMDIVLDEKKPVWFLDEPLTNMDSERRSYFWKTLENAFNKGLLTVFFIDHWMDSVIKSDKDFRYYGTLSSRIENLWRDKPSYSKIQEIEIYENSFPDKFINKQVRKIKREMSSNK
ncbi:ATP-binding cassette domain-containing protein [Thermodesulfobacteriota bacterium]